MILLLVGCLGYTEGQVQRGERSCEWLDVCGELGTVGFTDVGECKSAAAAQPYDDADCPEYDPKAMRTCIDAYDSAIAAADCGADFATACLVCG